MPDDSFLLMYRENYECIQSTCGFVAALYFYTFHYMAWSITIEYIPATLLVLYSYGIIPVQKAKPCFLGGSFVVILYFIVI